LLTALPACYALTGPQSWKILDQMSAKYQALESFQATSPKRWKIPSQGEAKHQRDIIVVSARSRLEISGQEVINDGK
jgi:hypothetical protein